MSTQKVAKPDARPQSNGAAINDLWEEAAKAFEVICGHSLQKGSVKSFDDVQKTIEGNGPQGFANGDSSQQADWDKAKSVGLQSLKYLKLLVSVAAQGASFIPVPTAAANMASNALCFVFDVPQSIKAYNDAINQVFTEISSTLAQVQIYKSMDKLDDALVHQIHLVMISFVKLTAHVVKYKQGSKRERFLHKLKAGVLKDDSDLASEMTEFKRVLQQQRDVEGTVTLAVVVKTDQNVSWLMERSVALQKTADVTRQEVQSLFNSADRVKQLNKIKETLELPQAVNFNETKASAISTENSQKCLPGTGDWIWDHEAFKKWTISTKRHGVAPHVLFVSGPTSSGKTLACSLITKRLETHKEGDRTYVAHYSFPKKQDSDATSPGQQALKNMAFQIASTDPTVQDSLYKTCSADNASKAFATASRKLSTLWEKFRIGGPGSGQKYYLVFDGLENLPEHQVKELADFILGLQAAGDSKSAGHMRILATGSHEPKFEDLKSRTSLHIDMKESNLPDMRILIKHKLAEKGMLQDPRPNSEQQRARDEILEQLPKKVNGSYSSLLFGIGEVIPLLSTRNAMENLRRKLDQNISGHEIAIKTLQSLTEDEINELNELLKWVIFSQRQLTLEELEAAMLPYSGTESLVTLQYMIENKYSAILAIVDGYVTVQDVVSDHLMETSDTSRMPLPAEQQSLISMTITVKNVDQETCGNFLWDLAHKSNREKFKFDFQEAFNAGRSNRATIAVNEIDAHHTIVQRAFKYLEQDPTDQTKNFGKYAVEFLPNHLGKLRQLQYEKHQPLKSQELQEIGKNLYMLFKDNKMMDRHKETFELICWDVENMESMQDWLTDSWVVMGIEDTTWRAHVKQIHSPPRGYLQAFARMIVETLLRKRGYSYIDSWTFEQLQEFIEADKKTTPTRALSATDMDQTSSPSTSGDDTDWDQISNWCRDLLGLQDSELDSLWFEQLATIASARSSDISTVTSLYDRALKADNPITWLCHLGLGEAYYGQEDFAKALEHMEEALKDAIEHSVPRSEKVNIFTLTTRVGKCAEKAGNPERATECFLSARSMAETPEEANAAQLGLLKAKLNSADARETREWLHGVLAEKGGDDQMAQILKTAAVDYDHLYEGVILRLIAAGYEDTDLQRVIMQVLEAATTRHPVEKKDDENPDEKGKLSEEDWSVGVLLYYRGLATYTYKASTGANESIAEALRLWEECRNDLSAYNKREWNPAGYTVCSTAVIEPAQHHFLRLLESGSEQLDGTHFDSLVQLADVGDEYGTNHASGLLAALHARRGDADRSRAVLVKRVTMGLQMLSDETPDNDKLGFSIVHQALVQNADFVNAAIALMLYLEADPVVASLTSFTLEDLPDFDGMDKQQVLDVVTQLSESVHSFLDGHVASILSRQDSARQDKRFESSIQHVDSCLAALKSGQPDVDSSLDAKAQAVAYEHIRAKLSTGRSDSPPYRYWPWSCDLRGRSLDGKATTCDNDTIYHCVYCTNIDFCEACLGRLRSLDDPFTRHITSCSSKHRWVKLPSPTSRMYVGPEAKYVRTPCVRSREGDDQILEIFDAGDMQVPISVDMWQKELTRTWSVVLEEDDGNVSADEV